METCKMKRSKNKQENPKNKRPSSIIVDNHTSKIGRHFPKNTRSIQIQKVIFNANDP